MLKHFKIDILSEHKNLLVVLLEYASLMKLVKLLHHNCLCKLMAKQRNIQCNTEVLQNPFQYNSQTKSPEEYITILIMQIN